MSWFIATWAGLLGLICAALAVTRPLVVHALLFLVAALLCLAAAFFALAASFAAAIQILIYAGAITAVFVFVVMSVDAGPKARALERAQLARSWRWPALVLVLVLIPLLFGLSSESAGAGAPAETTARQLGLMLFGPWAITIELVSLMLLASVIGVRHLGRARGEKVQPEKETP